MISKSYIKKMFRDFKKYEIFEDGRIWSYSHNKWLKPTPNEKGYYRIHLTDNDGNKKYYSLHRVVYESVTGQPIPEDKEVNHIDENKNNNAFSNLNLMTRQENVIWSLGKPVAQYDKNGNLIRIYKSLSEIEKYGFKNNHISDCCRGKRKSANGFIWKYI